MVGENARWERSGTVLAEEDGKVLSGFDKACVVRIKLRCGPDMCAKNLVWMIKGIPVYD